MKSILEFIVHIPQKYSETFVTECGLELYGDKRFSRARLANTQVKIVELPLSYEGSVNVGTTLLIDATVVLTQIYSKNGEQESIHLVDRKKGLYKVDKSMIIAYQNESGEWFGFNNHVLIKRIPFKRIENGPLKIPVNKKFEKGKGILKLTNNEIVGCSKGDIIYFNETYCVEVWLNDESLLWVRNRDLFAIEIKESA